MIEKNERWVWSLNEANEIDLSTVGKWLMFGSKEFMEQVFPYVDSLVEKGLILQAKYSHRENKDADPFWDEEPVMCVYADDKTKEQTLQILRKLGIKPVRWKYDRETDRDWQPGGKLYEKAKERGFDPSTCND